MTFVTKKLMVENPYTHTKTYEYILRKFERSGKNTVVRCTRRNSYGFRPVSGALVS